MENEQEFKRCGEMKMPARELEHTAPFGLGDVGATQHRQYPAHGLTAG